MKLKELFDAAENGVLTYEQFEAAATAKGAKFVDLSEDGYVSKNKYTSELGEKDKQIATLNQTIKTRDTDLDALKVQLTEAGTDAKKLTALTDDLTNLQSKYDADVKSYKEMLKKQAYEFACREYANSQNFTSSAAKRDFTQSMIAKDLKMEKGNILGADDFREAYRADNADAFVVDVAPTETPEPSIPLPTFGQPTPPQPAPEKNEFLGAFNFLGVRPHDE